MTNEECISILTPIQTKTRNVKIERYLITHEPAVYKYIMEQTKFLKLDVTFLERIYNINNNLIDINKCPCGNLQPNFDNYRRGYVKYCSETCRLKYRGQAIKQSFMDNYGVSNPSKLSEVTERRKKTCMTKYGATCSLMNPDVRSKSVQTHIKKYGTTHFNKSQAGRDKFKNTCMTRYGVAAPMQLPEFKEKQSISGYKNKTYILPSGKEISYQGYENRYFDILLKTYDESQLKFHEDIPEFWYVDAGGISHRYYPDVYIPIDNLIIEIKSAYTATTDKIKNILKERSVKDAGYTYNIVVFDEECRGGKHKVFESFQDISVKNRILV
jgi:hypothetical protein